MGKTRIALVGILVVMFGAGLTAAGCSSDDSSSPDTGPATGSAGSAAPAGEKKPADDSEASGKARPGEYVEYSSELVASTPGEKLLFFHADWCPQCVALEEDIEASGVPDGVTIFKVDYDSNQDLRQEYGVTIQTSVVKVDDNGDKVDSYVAYEDPTLDNVAAALLQ